jgi:hypothetical protein
MRCSQKRRFVVELLLYSFLLIGSLPQGHAEELQQDPQDQQIGKPLKQLSLEQLGSVWPYSG